MTRRGSGELGFSIIEVIVATLVVVMAAATTFGLLSTATKNTERAKASQVALDRAQREVEALRSLTNEELALTDYAAPSSNPLEPGIRVSNNEFALTREPMGDYATMVVNGGSLYGKSGEEGLISGGVVNPGPVAFTSGDVSGKVYRYVVWRNDDSCGASCPGEQDFKRIVVAVKLDKPGNQAAERGYVEVHSDFVDPGDSPASDPVAGEHGVVTAQQFFLSDTPCAASGATGRQAIGGDHLLHNTLGACANGPQTGTTEGAPDALLLGGAPDPAPDDDDVPVPYDYSDDYYLEPTPDTDKGVQIRRDDTNGCHYVPTGTTNPESQVHRWVTDPMESSFTLTGSVTLEFNTRTLNDALYTGTLCVYLYKRHEEGEPAVEFADTLLTNTNGGTEYWTYSPEGKEPWWPRLEWRTIRLTMEFNGAPYTIPAGDRLGVALSVERSNTPADAIPIMYDHPDFLTRIEVDTNTPVDGG